MYSKVISSAIQKNFTIICFTSAQLLKGEHDLISDVRVVIRWN